MSPATVGFQRPNSGYGATSRLGRYSAEQAWVAHEDAAPIDGLRFAFYGRMSIKDHQDKQTSYLWQQENAWELIMATSSSSTSVSAIPAGCHGHSVRKPVRFLPPLADPSRAFDAIVIGECEPAFYSKRFFDLLPEFTYHGIQGWLPELCGPYDPTNQTHPPSGSYDHSPTPSSGPDLIAWRVAGHRG